MEEDGSGREVGGSIVWNCERFSEQCYAFCPSHLRRLYKAVKIISSFNEISSIRVNDFSEKMPFLQHLIFVKIYYSDFFPPLAIKFSSGLYFSICSPYDINKTIQHTKVKQQPKSRRRRTEPKLRSRLNPSMSLWCDNVVCIWNFVCWE